MSVLNKRFRSGTHRSVLPEETYARILPFFNAMGITRVGNITGLDDLGIPVFVTCRPNSRSLSVTQGKGITAEAARVSSVMESVEFFHAENIVQPLLFASRNQLRETYRLAPIDKLPKSSLGRFNDDRKIAWISGVDLLAHAEVFLPYELVHMDFSIPLMTGSGCFSMSSNGLASGNHLFEAIIHGICEVIERDADTLFDLMTQEQQSRKQIDPSTVTDPECATLLMQMHERGMRAAVWDITSDVGVPAFRCYMFDKRVDGLRCVPPSKGMGCHPNRGIALSRALTEAAQCRLTWIASSRDDMGWDDYRRAADTEMIEKFTADLLATPATRSYAEAPHFENDDFETDIECLKSRLTERGIAHLIVVDLTLDKLGIPVVRVVVPGLEGPREMPGWVPGARALRTVEETAP